MGAIFSAALGCYLEEHFFVQARINYIWTDRDGDSLSFLVGIGVEFDPTPLKGYQAASSERNALTLFAGMSTSNNSDSNSATAWELEYRRRFGNYLEMSASYLDEGDNGTFHRDGITLQLWGAIFSFDSIISKYCSKQLMEITFLAIEPANRMGGAKF